MAAPFAFLSADGAMSALVRGHDWAATPLGEPGRWPPALKTLLGVMVGSPQPMLLVWGAAQTTLYNEGYAVMLGGRHPGALGQPFGEVWFDIWDQVEPILARAYAGEPTYMRDIEFQMRRHGFAEETHFDFSYTPVRDETGGVIGMFCVCTETTERVAAEKALARTVVERTRERDGIWTLIPDLLMTGTLDGRLLSVNPAWTRLLGHDEATLLAMPFWELIHPDDLDASAAAVAEMRRGNSARHENRVRAADGRYYWFDWVSTPKGNDFHAVARDITAVRQRQAELETAQEQLRQSQKMEAVGQLTGGIAHDFNNMLAVVIGSLDLLSRRIEPEDTRSRRYVDNAMEGGRRAAALTQRLLAFSRQQPLSPEAIDGNRLVSGMSELLRHTLSGSVVLDTVYGGGLWRCHVDPNQLENAILNLAVNARDAMPDGGRLTIETQNASLVASDVAGQPGLVPGHYVLVAVSDTGIGMPEEVIAKAFDPFFTTKEIGKGTGLGLSMVYGFVKQSGGHVQIESALGEGTTVRIYLPRYYADVALELVGSAAAVADSADKSQELVLVVEDDPTVRQVTLEALQELGYPALAASGAGEALHLLDAYPGIAVLFTDIVMPDVNGRRLADAALQRRPGLKVLFTTGDTRDGIAPDGALDPGIQLIGKPFTLDDLATKVRAALDASAPA